jgi:hypothetical protein
MIYAAVLDGPEIARCRRPLRGDLNGDCRVDFQDMALMAMSWLECELDPPQACRSGFKAAVGGGRRRPPRAGVGDVGARGGYDGHLSTEDEFRAVYGF